MTLWTLVGGSVVGGFRCAVVFPIGLLAGAIGTIVFDACPPRLSVACLFCEALG